jgi:hypothetical protein
MAHVRKLIRDNIETTLTGLATTGANVYQTRVYPIAEDRLPGLAIYTSSESTDYATINPPRTQLRTLSVSVDVYAKAVTAYDDLLDAACVEIEEALYTDRTRGGNAKDTRIIAFDSDFSGDGDQPVARATLTVEVDYVTIENDVEAGV